MRRQVLKYKRFTQNMQQITTNNCQKLREQKFVFLKMSYFADIVNNNLAYLLFTIWFIVTKMKKNNLLILWLSVLCWSVTFKKRVRMSLNLHEILKLPPSLILNLKNEKNQLLTLQISNMFTFLSINKEQKAYIKNLKMF